MFTFEFMSPTYFQVRDTLARERRNRIEYVALVVLDVRHEHLAGLLVVHDVAHVEVAEVAALLQHDLRAAEVREREAVLQAVHQLDDLVVVVGEIQVGGPRELVAEVLEPAQRQFEALVLHVTGVHVLLAVSRAPRRGDGEELVLGVGLVIGGVYVQTVLEELSVETDLERVGLFGFQRAERHRFGRVDGALVAVGIARIGLVDGDVVADDGVRTAEFEQVDIPAHVHETV